MVQALFALQVVVDAVDGMFLHPSAYVRAVHDDIDARSFQILGWPDPRKLEQLGGCDRACRHDDFAPAPELRLAPADPAQDAFGPALFDDDAVHLYARPDH